MEESKTTDTQGLVKVHQTTMYNFSDKQGAGIISKTVNENFLGIYAQGIWVGDDSILLQIPLLYTATANTRVKVLAIS